MPSIYVCSLYQPSVFAQSLCILWSSDLSRSQRAFLHVQHGVKQVKEDIVRVLVRHVACTYNSEWVKFPPSCTRNAFEWLDCVEGESSRRSALLFLFFTLSHLCGNLFCLTQKETTAIIYSSSGHSRPGICWIVHIIKANGVQNNIRPQWLSWSGQNIWKEMRVQIALGV